MKFKIAVALCLLSTAAIAADSDSAAKHAAVCSYGGRHYSQMASLCTTESIIETCSADGKFSAAGSAAGACVGERSHHTAASLLSEGVQQPVSDTETSCLYSNRRYRVSQIICISDVESQSCKADGTWSDAVNAGGSCKRAQ
jgi:hypothetical protein